jgi:hypothetical protein
LGIEMPVSIAAPVGESGEDGAPDSAFAGPDPDATTDQVSVEESPETDRAQAPVETETEAASAEPIGDSGEEDPISRVASSHEIG